MIALLLLLIATGAGLRILRLLRVYDELSLGERIVFSVGIGLGVLALLMFAMGVLGVITLFSGLLVLIALAGGSYTALREVWPGLRVACGSSLRGLRYPPNLFLAAF